VALIPPFFLDCVVAIGLIASASDAPKQWVASGFLYAEVVKQASSVEKNEYVVFLVTNRHVFQGHKEVSLRFNPKTDEPAREFKLSLEDSTGKRQWFSHPNPKIDIAIAPINTQALREQKIKYGVFLSDKHVLDRSKALADGISEGDGAYILGFPMGLIGGQRNYVIVRQGTIARLRDYLAGTSTEFLVDATIFPGNSGGPVITRPELTSIQGTKNIQSAHLVGVIQGYLPYDDVAISTQTKRPRVIFEENSGLASVVPMDYVKEVVTEFIETHPTPDLPSDTVNLNPSGQ
jgi:S1-C subfamily serine protease